MSAPERRGWWPRRAVVAAGVAASLVIVSLVLVSMIVTGNAVGSAAIDTAQRAATAELSALRDGAAAQGQTLRTEWAAVPSPRGDSHMVTVRLELWPSGEVSQAAFLVAGTDVVPQDPLARRLVAARRRPRRVVATA